MAHRQRPPHARYCVIFGATVLLTGPLAHAVTFETDEGLKASWNTTITLGQSRRTQSADAQLIGRSFDNSGNAKGGVGSDAVDDGELNFRNKGAIFSTQLKAVSDVEVKYERFGAVVRGKTWYDQALRHRDVSQGAANEGTSMGPGRLSDDGLTPGNRFQGGKLLDAMVYGNWDLPGSSLTARLGRQAVNWGESMFIQGVNQINPIDVTALRKPGTEVKEAFLPVNMLYANLGVHGGPSIEGFYQFEWERSQLDPCGTLFSGFDGGLSDPGCRGIPINAYYSTLSAGLAGQGVANWYNDAFHYRNGLVLNRREDTRPKDSGQWGLSMRYLAEAIDTEFGVYYMNVHSKTPIVSVTTPNMGLTTPNAALIAAGAPSNLAVLATRLQSINYMWEYVPDVRVMGLSAATSVAGWAVGSELTYVKDMPVQLNGSDMFAAATAGRGPLASRLAGASPGDYFRGYDLMDKTQFQLNGAKVFSGIAGADSVSIAGEAAFSYANDLPDYTTARYMRGFQWGFAAEGGGANGTNLPCAATASPTLGSAAGCRQDGFATKTAWGYRVRAQVNYSNVMSGLILSPGVSWSHDVHGYSIDSQFVKGRRVLGLSLKADYQKRYFGELSYVHWADSATYDSSRDKDFVSLYGGVTF